jgi:hypothetical protein
MRQTLENALDRPSRFLGEQLMSANDDGHFFSTKWEAAANGVIPDGAVAHGREPDGAPLFVCRADYDGGTYPGTIGAGFVGCRIGLAHRIIIADRYQVLVAAEGASDAGEQTDQPSACVQCAQAAFDLADYRFSKSGLFLSDDDKASIHRGAHDLRQLALACKCMPLVAQMDLLMAEVFASNLVSKRDVQEHLSKARELASDCLQTQ